jgi:hypothetical protein
MSGSVAGARQSTPNSGGNAGSALMQQNAAARSLILSQAVNMVQSIYSTTIANPGTTNNTINISPRLVGLVKRFYVEITATFNNSGGATANLTQFGPANILSQIIFTDLSNNVRINTAGWHAHLVASAKRQGPFAAAYTTDSPVGFGSNWNVIKAAATIAASGNSTLNMVYEVPLSYSDTDFRGAQWLGVTNATANLQLTVNPAPFKASGDSVLSVYSGSAGSITSITINVYQHYLDQLPTGKNGVVLPISDISTVYLLNSTSPGGGLVANQDFPIPYANFRDFLSTMAVFDNGGTLNTGSDVNYWSIQAANYVNLLKIDPTISAMFSRNLIGDDFPAGTYYFSHRHRPISTIQYGNMELILNASTVNANANVLMGYESFALVNLVAQAGALAIS